jgi:hypothetical protein
MAKSGFLLALALGVVATVLSACGTSGSNPVLFPEVRFEVIPLGPTTFQVESLVAGGVDHDSVYGKDFTATAPFVFVVENAAPPYAGVFKRTGSGAYGGDFTVNLRVTGQIEQSDSTATGKNTAEVGTNPPPTPGARSSPEVRIDVCAPSANGSSCFTPGDSGIFGIGFTGNLGDPFTTHLLPGPCPTTADLYCTATPSIFFLEEARDSVNAVFNGPLAPSLLAQLFVNGDPRLSTSGTTNLLLREDLKTP